MESVDFLIVGAGIVGLAGANELPQRRRCCFRSQSPEAATVKHAWASAAPPRRWEPASLYGGGRPMTLEELDLLLAEGEGLTVEFKERFTPRIDRDLVALANASVVSHKSLYNGRPESVRIRGARRARCGTS